LHLCNEATTFKPLDIAMVGTFRKEYCELLEGLQCRLDGLGLTFGIGGSNWDAAKGRFPGNWVFPGELFGRSYTTWLRQAKICIAPLGRSTARTSYVQPDDVDTTRTYELAAANCFYIHKRTDFVKGIFEEETEVPMFGSAEELADKIAYFLPREEDRMAMANAAHRRAVPAYSLDERAEQVVGILRSFFGK
jgi:hypothetical protein